MSDRRSFLRGRVKACLPANDDAAAIVALSARDVTRGRRRKSLAHLAPISLTPVEPLELPVANRNSA